jgi:hypothetical protein
MVYLFVTVTFGFQPRLTSAAFNLLLRCCSGDIVSNGRFLDVFRCSSASCSLAIRTLFHFDACSIISTPLSFKASIGHLQKDFTQQ